MQAEGNPYGITTDTAKADTHMMKASEWGAIAYLTEAIIDRNEVWINNSSNFITGNAGNSVSAATDVGGLVTYTTLGGQKASTTGNEYGVYDLSGGAYNYAAIVASRHYISNGHSNLTIYGTSLLNAEPKYKTTFSTTPGASVSQVYMDMSGLTDRMAIHEVRDVFWTLYNEFQGYNDIESFPR